MFSSKQFKTGLTALLPRLKRYALSLTGAGAQADDLLQATCERALARWTQLKDLAGMDKWLFTIMSSVWKNDLRAAAIRSGTGFVDPQTLDTLANNHTLEGNLYFAQVLNLIMELPETQRSTLTLVYIEGYSYAEAADILDIPVGTVMSRLARARVVLSERLKANKSPPSKQMANQQ